MRIPIDKIKPNPFRDFHLYPIDEVQVDRLARSINEIGFFTGVTARKDANGGYELGAGHTRTQAAKNLGLTHVEAVVDNYSDEDMVKIMTDENLLQRGHNTPAILDSVAANARIVARHILLGDIGEHVNLPTDPSTLPRLRQQVADAGPGWSILYRFLNGFDYDAKTDQQQMVKKETLVDAISTLRATGDMGRIISGVLEEVEAIRAEEEAEAERQRLAEEEKARKEEEKRLREEQRREEAAARMHREWLESQKKARLKEEKKAKDAKEAEAEAKRREKEWQAYQQEMKEKATAEAEAKRIADEEKARLKDEAAAEKTRRAEEKERIKKQKELEAVYDVRCSQVFTVASHEAEFRMRVLSDLGRMFIPREQQYPLALKIKGQVKESHLSANTIRDSIDALIEEAERVQSKVRRDEEEEIIKADRIKRVERLWVKLRASALGVEREMRSINEAQKDWAYDKALFPMRYDVLNDLVDVANTILKMQKKLGF